MLTIKGMKHVRTGRNVKGFRSCPQATGVSQQSPLLPGVMGNTSDAARLAREEKRLLARKARRLWLEDQWTRHFEAAVPPLARSRRTKGK
jgi:hypothetical protein